MESTEAIEIITEAAAGDVALSSSCIGNFHREYTLCACVSPDSARLRRTVRRSPSSPRGSIATLELRSRFSTWLHRIAVNTVLARRRGLRFANEVAEPATGLPTWRTPAQERRRSI